MNNLVINTNFLLLLKTIIIIDSKLVDDNGNAFFGAE